MGRLPFIKLSFAIREKNLSEINGHFLFYFLLLFVVGVILIGIIYLSYWIPKKFGKRKLGIILSRTLILGVGLLVLAFIIDDFLYF